MMASKESFSAPVVFADRFFMSEKSLAEISALGGFAWADVKDHLELIDRLSGSRSVRVLVPNTSRSMPPFWNRLLASRV
jgi:hypothetical protein